jgi:hypothetical protein
LQRAKSSQSLNHDEGKTMAEQAQEPLNVLKQLALEYEDKLRQLEGISQTTEPDSLAQLLRVQAEHTTERLRKEQLPLLNMLTSAGAEGEREKAYRAAITLCRCFDEMRIMLQVLLQQFPPGRKPINE